MPPRIRHAIAALAISAGGCAEPAPAPPPAAAPVAADTVLVDSLLVGMGTSLTLCGYASQADVLEAHFERTAGRPLPRDSTLQDGPTCVDSVRAVVLRQLDRTNAAGLDSSAIRLVRDVTAYWLGNIDAVRPLSYREVSDRGGLAYRQRMDAIDRGFIERASRVRIELGMTRPPAPPPP